MDEQEPVPMEDMTKEHLFSQSVRSQLPHHMMRIYLAATTLVGLLCIGGVIVHSLSNTRSLSSKPATYKAQVLLASQYNPATGILNGVPLAGSLPLLVTPPNGENILTIIASPFAPHICHFQWSALGYATSQGDPSCLIVSTSIESGSTSTISQSLVFLPSLQDLSPAQLAQLHQVIAASLPEISLTIPIGSYYITGIDTQGNIMSQRAHQPLQAKVEVVPEMSAIKSKSYDRNILTPNNQWPIDVSVEHHWQIQDNQANTFSDVSITSGVEADITIQMSPTGILSATIGNLSYFQSLCSDAQQSIIQAMIASKGPASLSRQTIQDRGLEGCELAVIPDPNNGSASYLYRFGVLLAVNTFAQKLTPAIPLAPLAEVAAIEQNG